MSESLPVPAQSGVARLPLDPTDVVPGPQPIEPSTRDGHQVILGEVLKGRHRGSRRGGRIAVSGAVLTAAGAFVSLALMMSHDSSSASAAPRIAPSSPLPDAPQGPTATVVPTHTAAGRAPVHRAAPAAAHTTVSYTSTTAAAHRTRTVSPANAWRKEAVQAVQAWATAMRQAQTQPTAGQQQYYQSGEQSTTQYSYGGSHGYGQGWDGHRHHGWRGR